MKTFLAGMLLSSLVWSLYVINLENEIRKMNNRADIAEFARMLAEIDRDKAESKLAALSRCYP